MDNTLEHIKAYYDAKINKYGAVPAGVDWNSVESQNSRFELLLDVIEEQDKDFSILDYGCGYGALYSYLLSRFIDSNIKYIGYDVSIEMIKAAKKNYDSSLNVVYTLNYPEEKVDYCIASGIFNVKTDNVSIPDWEEYIKSELHKMNNSCRKGFSFNMLTSYNDFDSRKAYLYYADPLFYANYCIVNFSPKIKLSHGVLPYDFTINVLK